MMIQFAPLNAVVGGLIILEAVTNGAKGNHILAALTFVIGVALVVKAFGQLSEEQDG